jgi:hypothetical protein
MLPKDSLEIAKSEATKYLNGLGDEALFSEDEIFRILAAAFTALRRGESDKETLNKGIIELIDSAAARMQSDNKKVDL